jgi:hypothetical protein
MSDSAPAAPRPPELRPLGVGEILDASIKVFLRNASRASMRCQRESEASAECSFPIDGPPLYGLSGSSVGLRSVLR